MNTSPATNQLGPVPRVKKQMSQRRFVILLVLPTVLAMGSVVIYPLVNSFILSLKQWSVIGPANYVGLRNYILLMQDPTFWNSLKITLTFTIAAFTIEFVLGFGLALLLNLPLRGTGVMRAIIITPLMLTPVVLGLNWRMMLNLEFGVINYLLELVGIAGRAWASEQSTALWSILVVDVWHTTSNVVLIMSAGLAALPEEPYESAAMDGASWWQSFKYLTFPMLKPVMLVVALYRGTNLFQIFDKVFMLTGGGPGRDTETLSFYIFQTTFTGWQVSYGTAASFVMLIMSLAISLTMIRLLRSDS